MAKYIDLEDAIKVADYECGEFRGIFGRIKEQLEAMSTADAEKIATEYCMKKFLVMIPMDYWEKVIVYENRGTVL